MRTITLDLERMTSVPALHKYLRSALALPVHAGSWSDGPAQGSLLPFEGGLRSGLRADADRCAC